MKNGSYTVEAALLMGILIPLLVGVIYVGCYRKAKGEVFGCALESALSAALTEEEQAGVTMGEDKISASVRREIPEMPFGGLFFRIPDHVEGKCVLERQQPARTVFRLHSMKKVIRQVKEE